MHRFLVYLRFPESFSVELFVVIFPFSSATFLAPAAVALVWMDGEPPFNRSFSLGSQNYY